MVIFLHNVYLQVLPRLVRHNHRHNVVIGDMVLEAVLVPCTLDLRIWLFAFYLLVVCGSLPCEVEVEEGEDIHKEVYPCIALHGIYRFRRSP